jgi:hypothetical protein
MTSRLTTMLTTLVVLAVAAPAMADERLIDFDGLGATQLTTQYAPMGVAEFGDGPRDLSECNAVFEGPNTMPASPPNAASGSGHGEFPRGRLCMRFSENASHVSVQAAPTQAGPFTVVMSLIGYDQFGQQLTGSGTDSHTVWADGLTNRAHHFAISTPGPAIRWAVIQVGPPGELQQATLPAIDDLRFDGETPVPTTFSVASSPSHRVIRAGSTVQFGLSVLRFGSVPSSGNLSFSASGLPQGVTATFSPNPLGGSAPAQHVTMTLHATSNAPQTTGVPGPITITATPASPAVGPAPVHLALSATVVPALRLRVADAVVAEPTPGTVGHTPVLPCSGYAVPIYVSVPESDSPPPGAVALSAAGPPGATWVDVSLNKSSVVPGIEPLPATLATLNLATHPYAMNDGANTVMKVTATATGGVIRSVPLAIQRSPAVITTLHDGGGATAPSQLAAGGLKEIWGRGFCAGSQVVFGNPLATATPTSLTQGNPDIIEVRTPRLVTSGKLTVVDPAGGTASASLYAITPRNTFGFQFRNYGVPTMDWDVPVALFGKDQTMADVGDPCGMFTLGLVDCGPALIPDPVVWTWWQVVRHKAENGVCFGWALATQRLQRAEASPGDFPPGYPTSHQWELYGKNAPSSELNFYIQQQHVAQFSSEYANHDLSGDSDFVSLSELRSRYRAALPPAQGVGFPMIRMRFGSSGHAVLVTDAVDTPGGGLDLFVIDPNVPFTPQEDSNPALHLNREYGSRVHFTPNGDWTFFNPFAGVLWTGGLENVRYAEAADVPPHPTLQLGASASWVLISDGADALRVSAPDAVVTPTYDGAARSSPSTLTFRRRDPVTVHMAPRGRGDWRTAFLMNSTAGLIDSGARQDPQVDLDPRAAAVTFHATDPAPLHLRLAVRAPDGSRRSATLALASTRGSDRLAFDSTRHAILITHHGPPTTASLALEWVGRHGSGRAPGAFAGTPIPLRDGERVVMRPVAWHRLRAGVALMRRGTTRLLRDRSRAARGARLASLRIRGRAGRARTFVIRTRYRSLPDGTTVTQALIVRRGARVVGKRVRRLMGQAVAGGRHTTAWRFQTPAAGRYRADAVVLLILPDGRTSIQRRTHHFTVR